MSLYREASGGAGILELITAEKGRPHCYYISPWMTQGFQNITLELNRLMVTSPQNPWGGRKERDRVVTLKTSTMEPETYRVLVSE